ncbi:hypothetical protein [Prauserella cavernicola]|uniref:Uncharacterized protein n=1 Tax=Prauserella cavernicola TaxID=2800127 RepID=A0A934V2J6_9PSEU|nr:hypothetical protein [Prauserella cavernicola]MBK1785906.1 hypothetical protein [Prauserella cavernicola]
MDLTEADRPGDQRPDVEPEEPIDPAASNDAPLVSFFDDGDLAYWQWVRSHRPKDQP